MPDYWCYTKLDLRAVFSKFCSVWPSTDFIDDAENEWEWIEGKTNDGSFGFNISRRHDLGEPMLSEPLILKISIYNLNIHAEEIGASLLHLLSVDMYMGEIKYIDGNEYLYNEISKFTTA